MKTRLASVNIGFNTGETNIGFPVYSNTDSSTSINGVQPISTGDAIQDIIKKESGGNYKAVNPKSSAAGKYQFLWNTWQPKITQYTGIRTKEDFLNNPKAQDDFFYNYYLPFEAKPAIKRLKGKFGNIATDDEMLKLFHFRGEGGANEYLSGNLSDTPEGKDNMPISKYTGIKKNFNVDKNRNKTFPQFALGGNLPKYTGIPKLGYGAILSTASTMLQPLGQLIEGDGTDVGKSVASGLLQGGLIGGAVKGVQSYRANKLRLEKENRNNFFSKEVDAANSNNAYSMLETTIPKGYYSKGGVLTPDYEVEKDEVVVGDANIENSKTLAPGIQKVGGKTHEEGGTLGQGGDFALSNRLFVDDRDVALLEQLKIKVKHQSTYADAAEQIVKQNKKFIKPSFRYRESNTNKAMIGRMQEALQLLAISQENQKQQ